MKNITEFEFECYFGKNLYFGGKLENRILKAQIRNFKKYRSKRPQRQSFVKRLRHFSVFFTVLFYRDGGKNDFPNSRGRRRLPLMPVEADRGGGKTNRRWTRRGGVPTQMTRRGNDRPDSDFPFLIPSSLLPRVSVRLNLGGG